MSFRFCTDQKDVAKNVYEVDQELGGGELSLSACPGEGKRQGCARGGMVTSKIEPCITSLPCGDLKTLSRVTSFGQRIISFKEEAKIAFGKRII